MVIKTIAIIYGSLMMMACGGGSGIGPNEIFEQETQLRDRLPTDWTHYRDGDYLGAVEFFTETLENASTFDGSESIFGRHSRGESGCEMFMTLYTKMMLWRCHPESLHS